MSALTDTLALDVATALTLLGLVAASLRLFLGPSRADRVVALDLITVLLIAIASLAALRFDDAAYLDLGLTLALVGFLATVAFARYVESGSADAESASAAASESGDARAPGDPPAVIATTPTDRRGARSPTGSTARTGGEDIAGRSES